jgi:hypothetical protein
VEASEEATTRVRVVVFDQTVRGAGVDISIKRRTGFRSLDDTSERCSRSTRFRNLIQLQGGHLTTYLFVEVPIPYLANVA